jgi:hypothetical protein
MQINIEADREICCGFTLFLCGQIRHDVITNAYIFSICFDNLDIAQFSLDVNHLLDLSRYLFLVFSLGLTSP